MEALYYMACTTTSGTCHGMEMEGFRNGELPSLCLSRRTAETPQSPSRLRQMALACDGAKARGTEGRVLHTE